MRPCYVKIKINSPFELSYNFSRQLYVALCCINTTGQLHFVPATATLLEQYFTYLTEAIAQRSSAKKLFQKIL